MFMKNRFQRFHSPPPEKEQVLKHNIKKRKVAKAPKIGDRYFLGQNSSALNCYWLAEANELKEYRGNYSETEYKWVTLGRYIRGRWVEFRRPIR